MSVVGINGETFAKYFNKPYNLGRGVLKIGDTVIVHPVKYKSQSQEPYEARIMQREVNWVTGNRIELCTNVSGGHSAVLNDYLFNRLEKK